MEALLTRNVKQLENKITFLKEIMVQNGLKYGLNSTITIQASQELDKLIFEYQTQNR